MAKKDKLLKILILQSIIVLYALSSVAGKVASKYDFLSNNYVFFLIIEIIILGLYSIAWQQIIKKIDISTAYSNKATVIIWGLVFGVFIFRESISFFNIVGALIIISGILIINKS